MRPRVMLWLVLAVVAVAVIPVAADDLDEEKEPELVLRFYDVREFLVKIPDFGEIVPRMSIADVLSSSGRTDAFDDVIEQDERGDQRLRDLIERTVRPASPWEDMGGMSTIDFYLPGGRMIVTTTEKAHLEIEKLLAELGPSLTPLMIDVQVVELDPDFVAKVYQEGRFTFVDEADRQALAKAVRKELGRASLSAMDGQQAWHSSGVHHAYVSDAEPVVPTINVPLIPAIAVPAEEDAEAEDAGAADGPVPAATVMPPASVGYDPRVDYAVDGVVSDVRATLVASGSKAIVEYRLQSAWLLGMDDAMADAGKGQPPAPWRLKTPKVLCDQCNGTTRLLVGCPTLLASGSSEPPAGDADGPHGPAFRKHYIMTVHRVEREFRRTR